MDTWRRFGQLLEGEEEGEQLQVPLCKHLRGPDLGLAHIQAQVKKARKGLYHLRQLRKFRVSPAIMKTFLFTGP